MVLPIESAAVRFTRRRCPEAAHRQARNDLLRCRRDQIDNVLLVHWSSQDLVDTDSMMLAPEFSPDVHTIECRPRSRDL